MFEFSFSGESVDRRNTVVKNIKRENIKSIESKIAWKNIVSNIADQNQIVEASRICPEI